jgi:hypothetical protein
MQLPQALELIRANYLAVAVITGLFICFIGLLRFLFSKSASFSAVLVIAFGGIMAALPFIREASFNRDGLKLVTNIQESSTELSTAVSSNKQAISEIRTALDDTVQQIKALQIAGTSGGVNETAIATIERNIGNAATSLRLSEEASSRTAAKLQENQVILNRLK